MASPGLLNLRTDLKSLRYGSDKPYITKDINNPPSSNQTGMQITKRIDDLSRISQMLIDRPGLKFIGNQALLQQVDIQGKLEKARDKKQTLGGKLFEQAKGTVLNTAKIIGSTLAQVPVNGTGTHFVYAFRTDTYLQPSGGNTRSAFAQFFGAGGVEGAPLALRGELIEGEVESKHYNKETRDETRVNTLGYDSYLLPELPNDRLNKDRPFYFDGESSKDLAIEGQPIYIPVVEGSDRNLSTPNQTTATPSTLGVSNQNTVGTVTGGDITVKPFTQQDQESIKKSKNSTEQNIINVLTGSAIPLAGVRETTETVGTLGISNQTIDTGSLKAEGSYNTKIEDFRKKQGKAYSFDYNLPTINRERRVNLGNQGKVSFDRTQYSNTDPDTVDSINALDIQNNEQAAGNKQGRDFAKFYFEIITPDSKPRFLHFRAFIDSIDDSYNADWQGFKYVGRADSFYTYGGFERDINISFKIAAATRSEMKPLYRKMVLLASSTAPTYGGQGFMRGTLARLTVGSYFTQLPGVITSVKYSLIQDMPWELSMQSPEQGGDSDVQELPMGLQCSVSYKVIHDFAPQTGLYHYITNPNPEKAQDFLK